MADEASTQDAPLERHANGRVLAGIFRSADEARIVIERLTAAGIEVTTIGLDGVKGAAPGHAVKVFVDEYRLSEARHHFRVRDLRGRPVTGIEPVERPDPVSSVVWLTAALVLVALVVLFLLL